MNKRYQLAAVIVLVLSFAADVWGIRKNLPYIPEVDEPIFVNAAVHIAGTGDLNPGWFGNPGSTMIYPLAAAFRLWHAFFYSGSIFHPDPNLALHFNQSITAFYLLGRLLSIGYALLAVALTYVVGRKAFGARTAVVAVVFTGFSILAVFYSQLVRTDSAGTFFTMLSLWLCFKIPERRSVRGIVAAGCAVGLGIASRYFLLALLAPLGLTVLFGWYGENLATLTRPRELVKLASRGALALAVAALVFAVSTPYFFLDFSRAWHDVLIEARQTHLGADGLSPVGNLGWYLFSALPLALGWLQEALAALGAVLAVARRDRRQLVLLAYVVVFMFGTILSPLHWDRWMIQILPVLSLFAADALASAISVALRRRASRLLNRSSISALAVIAVVAAPGLQVASYDIGQTLLGTRIEANAWITANLPLHSHIAEEWYAAPFPSSNFTIQVFPSLATTSSPDDYRAQGFDYLIVSDNMYGRYFAEPDRYPGQIAFYRRLFEQGHLVRQFQPSIFQSGPVIRIYQIGPPDDLR